MRPRLLLLAPSAYTLGGLATWLDYLDPGLSEHGWEVTLGLVGGPRHHRPEQYVAAHALEIDAVRLRELADHAPINYARAYF